MYLLSETFLKINQTKMNRIQLLKAVIVLVLESAKSLEVYKADPEIKVVWSQYIVKRFDELHDDLKRWFNKNAEQSFGQTSSRWFSNNRVAHEIEVNVTSNQILCRVHTPASYEIYVVAVINSPCSIA